MITAILFLTSFATAQAAVLNIEILTNITSTNDSGTTALDPYSGGTTNDVNFSIHGDAPVAAQVLSGTRWAVLTIPAELQGHVTTRTAANNVTTDVTLDLNDVGLLTTVFSTVNDLATTLTDILNGSLGSLTGVELDTTQFYQDLNLLQNVQNLIGITYTAQPALSQGGTIIIADLDYGLGPILTQNLIDILQDLKTSTNNLEAVATTPLGDVVAGLINTALIPLKAAVTAAIDYLLTPLLGGADPDGVVNNITQQLLTASVLGDTTVSIPTTIDIPATSSGLVDSVFVGTVVQASLLDVQLLSTANGTSDVFWEGEAPDTTKPVVTAVSPSGTGAPLDGSVAITFDEEMDPAVAGTVTLNGTPITGGTWDSGHTVYTIPYTGLATSTTYTVGISGFADVAGNVMDADNTHSFTTSTNPAAVNITAIKTLNGTAPGSSTFLFYLRDHNGTIIQTKNNDGSGIIVFDTLSFNQTGTYLYTLVESVGSNTAINYDPATYSISIDVTQSGSALTAGVSYLKNGAAYSSVPAFTNTTKSTSGGNTGVPKTGDATNIRGLAMIMVLSLAGIGLAGHLFHSAHPRRARRSKSRRLEGSPHSSSLSLRNQNLAGDRQKKHKERKSPILIALTVLLTAVFLCSACLMVSTVIAEQRENAAFSELAALLVEPAPDESAEQREEPTSDDFSEQTDENPNVEIIEISPLPQTDTSDIAEEVSSKYQALFEENADFVGWLSIYDTNIDYPVMLSPDDPEYYLHRAFDGSKSFSGVPFFGKNCTLGSNNILIYGHNMKNGTMFADLLEYASEDFYKSHSIIHFDTLAEEAEYEIVSVFYSQVYAVEEPGAFCYYNYGGKLELDTFTRYVDGVLAASLFDTGVKPSYGDRLITLSTCSHHMGDGRFVVVAKKVI